MRCIEIYIDDRLNAGKSKININMRCIEIITICIICRMLSRLTLTWDVLKFDFVIAVVASPVD